MNGTGYAVIAAGFFLGAAVQVGCAEIAHAMDYRGGGGALFGGLLSVVAGVVTLIVWAAKRRQRGS